jgi:hypothetical protein
MENRHYSGYRLCEFVSQRCKDRKENRDSRRDAESAEKAI